MSVKVASTSSSIVRRNTASSAVPASGRTCSIESVSSPHFASGMPASANGFQTSSMNSLMNSRATARAWRSTLLDHVERVREAHAALDDLLGGREQRRARHLEVPLPHRDQDAELDRLGQQLPRVIVAR